MIFCLIINHLIDLLYFLTVTTSEAVFLFEALVIILVFAELTLKEDKAIGQLKLMQRLFLLLSQGFLLLLLNAFLTGI